MANFVILIGEYTKLSQNMNLLCPKVHKEMSLATIGCV